MSLRNDLWDVNKILISVMGRSLSYKKRNYWISYANNYSIICIGIFNNNYDFLDGEEWKIQRARFEWCSQREIERRNRYDWYCRWNKICPTNDQFEFFVIYNRSRTSIRVPGFFLGRAKPRGLTTLVPAFFIMANYVFEMVPLVTSQNNFQLVCSKTTFTLSK